MPTYTFTEKNHLECTTEDPTTIVANDLRECVLLALFKKGVKDEGDISDLLNAEMELFNQDGNSWVSGNEELEYIIKLQE